MDKIKSGQANHFLEEIQPALQRFGWLILVAWMGLVFVLVNFAFPAVVQADLSLYILQPIVWISLALLALGLTKVDGRSGLKLIQGNVVLTGFMLGGIQLAVGVILGLLLGFGHSPYARQATMVALNLWFFSTRLIGIEMGRWYLGKSVGKSSQPWGFLLAWLLPLALMIPVGQYAQLSQVSTAFSVTGQTLLPAMAELMLAASLVIEGGPLASIAYRGVLQAFEWLSPILPDLPWMAAALVGVVVPVLGMLVLNRPDPAAETPAEKPVEKPAEKLAAKKKKANEPASPLAWILTGIFAVLLIWLNTGFLGVRPSLMSGPSMNPTLYTGDVVVTDQVAPATIQVGDIIRFRRDTIDVVHRVVAIQNEGGQIVFTTRGDNNNVDDDPFPASRYEGKVILILPKIGWVSIYLRQALGWVGSLL